jgi:hypothetical protein
MKAIKKLQKQFTKDLINSGKITCFEIAVIDKRTNEEDYIIFDIEIPVSKGKLRASHVGLTEQEEQSEKIAFKSVDVNECFSLDEHLQELHGECAEAVCNSDFYELAE